MTAFKGSSRKFDTPTLLIFEMYAKGIKLVTFDVTNTLLKFRVPPWSHYAAVAREQGFCGSSDDIKERLVKNYKIMWDKHPNFGQMDITWEKWWLNVVKLTFDGQLPSCADVNGLAKRLIDEFKTEKCWKIAEGGKKLIKMVRDSGCSIGIISNFDPRLKEILHNIKIDSFEFILTSYETGYSKPDERIFQHALKQSKKYIKPSECLHIGDDFKKDYEGARKAGWHALLISNKSENYSSVDKKHVFSDLNELILALETKKYSL